MIPLVLKMLPARQNLGDRPLTPVPISSSQISNKSAICPGFWFLVAQYGIFDLKGLMVRKQVC